MKLNEIKDMLKKSKEMSVEELNGKVVELKQECFNLRMQKAMHKLENPAKINEVKKSIARIKTVISEKSKEL